MTVAKSVLTYDLPAPLFATRAEGEYKSAFIAAKPKAEHSPAPSLLADSNEMASWRLTGMGLVGGKGGRAMRTLHGRAWPRHRPLF